MRDQQKKRSVNEKTVTEQSKYKKRDLKTNKDKTLKIQEQNLSDLWDNIKQANIYVVKCPETEEKEWEN